MDNYDYGQQEKPVPNKSIKGYQIIIVVLAVILAALSFIYFNQMSSLKKEYAIERDTLSNRIAVLIDDYDNLQTTNDTIARNLGVERDKVDSLMKSLAKERNLNRQKIRQYEKELGTLRSVMRGYVHQIDSLNTLNQKLIKENVTYREQVKTESLRADKAEEKADELSVKVRKGSVITARDIAIVALSKNDRVMTRASRAERLRVDFSLSANKLAQPGNREIYVRVTGPDGYILPNATGAVFDHEGEKKNYSAMREVDYQNTDLDVSIFYKGAGITGGKYSVEIYMDGYLIGNSEVVLR